MTFMNVPALQRLNLADNRLYSLQGNRFQAFSRLQVLNLSSNAIDRVSGIEIEGSSAQNAHNTCRYPPLRLLR